MIDPVASLLSTTDKVLFRVDNSKKLTQIQNDTNTALPNYIIKAYENLPEVFDDDFDANNKKAYLEVIGPEPALDITSYSTLYKSLKAQKEWRDQYLKIRKKLWDKQVKTKYNNLDLTTTDDTNDESVRQLLQIASNTLQSRIQQNEISNEDLVKLITALSSKKVSGRGGGGTSFVFNVPPADIKSV